MIKRVCALVCVLVAASPVFSQKIIDYVNPFIGTAGHGHTYPGATLPFGMVQLSPDNSIQGRHGSSSYNYAESKIAGFSHTHLSGEDAVELLDISVLPVTGRNPDTSRMASAFSHTDEKASPGYYQVRLKDFNINAELTTSLRCGLHRYTFPASNTTAIKFDLRFGGAGDVTTESFFKKVDDSTFVGHRFSTGLAKERKVFFAVRTSKAVKNVTVFADKKRTNSEEIKAKDLLAFLNFNTDANEVILMKVGLSFADVEGAVESLNEIRTWDFNLVKKSAEEIWERELRKIQINTADERIKKIFYTAMYHTYLAPVIYSDRFGNYKGTRGDLKKGKMIMSNHSLSKTFRAANPLLTITQTEMIPALINSYLAFYEQHGALPTWDLQFNEIGKLPGYPAIPVMTDAILKGITGFDYEKAYSAMKISMQNNVALIQDNKQANEPAPPELAYYNWCMAQTAKKLNKTNDAADFTSKAVSWKRTFDKIPGGIAKQTSFFVPHDIQGLRKSYPNKNGLMHKLDSLFTITPTLPQSSLQSAIAPIDQYEHSNSSAHHTPYLYNYLQAPSKTAEKVREIATRLYTDQPDGLVGNENSGQLSAWYVFSALGFYPVNPASGEYVISSPLVDQSIMFLPAGKTFRVLAINNDKGNIYIQSATLNGKPYTKNYITHSSILAGGVLELTMGSKPGKKWGTKMADVPSSMPQ